MRFVKYLVIKFVLIQLIFGQDISSKLELMLNRPIPRWLEISYNSSLLIPIYFNENKIDSVESILFYWEEKCGLYEPIIRFKILFSIFKGSFNENIYNEKILNILWEYENKIKKQQKGFKNAWVKTEWLDFNHVHYEAYIDTSFNLFTQYLSKQLSKEINHNTPEYLLTLFYSNEFDTFYNEIKKQKYDDYLLKQYYNEFLNKELNRTDGNLTLISEIWFPYGNNKLLGNHPALGIILGFKKSKIIYNLALSISLFNSKNKYIVPYKGELKTTSNFERIYFGFEGGYELYKSNHFEFNGRLGIAYDGFTAIDSENRNDRKNISSLNKNLGLEFKYYPKKYSIRYFGFQLKHNWINYDTKGGSNLSGNSIVFRFLFGWSGNWHKNETLKKFKYLY